MAVRIFTDSVSDIPRDLAKSYGIEVLPLLVNFGDESYLDGVEIESQDFFDKLKASNKLPTTSQVSPGRFRDAFEAVLDDGDEIVGIFMASKMSGTFAAAVRAAEMLETEKISLIDSEAVTFGYGLLVLEAAKLSREGRSRVEIAERIEALKQRVEERYIVDTLEYLLKGGRLSPIHAMVGSLLNIKPILTCTDGELKVVNKVRGRKKAILSILEWLDNEKIDLNGKQVALFHAVDEPYMMELQQALIEKYPTVDFLYSKVGCVVGTHSGPGCVAISFFNESAAAV